MKRSFLTLLSVLLFFTINAKASGVIVLEGNYQGKNLYVQNPFASSGVGFCAFEVRINGEVTTDETNSSAFEVDFTPLQLELGAKVEVKIFHKDDCRPKILNQEVLKPKSTYELLSIKVNNDGILSWSTKGETGKLPYMVEQFKWNKWVNIGEVEGKGTPNQNDYSFKVSSHSGENQFRVNQIDYTGKSKPSPPAKLRSMSPEVTFSPIKVTSGDIDNKVDVSNLTKGIYYINFDNKTNQFVKK